MYMSGYTENAIGHTARWMRASPYFRSPLPFTHSKAKVREVLDQTTLPLEVAMSARAVLNPNTG